MRPFPRTAAAVAVALVAAGLAVPASGATTVTTTISGKALLAGSGGSASEVAVLLASPTAHLTADSGELGRADVADDGTYSVDVRTHPGSQAYLQVIGDGDDQRHVSATFVGRGGMTGLSELLLTPIVLNGGGLSAGTTELPLLGSVTYTASRAVACVDLLRGDGSLVREACVPQGGVRRTFTIDGVVPGRYKVRPGWRGHLAAGSAVAVSVAAGRTARASSTVGAPAVLRGTVRSAAGKPVAGIAVRATKGSQTLEAASDRAGRFELRGLTAGTYSVEYDGSSDASSAIAKYVTATAKVKVVQGRTTTANRSLVVGGTIKVTAAHVGAGTIGVAMLRANGDAVTRQSWPYRSRAGTSTVAVRGLATGTYTVVLRDLERHRYVTKTVAVKVGRSVSTGTLKPTTKTLTIKGTVAGARDGDVSASFGSSPVEADRATISRTGAYTLGDLVPSTYALAPVRLGAKGWYGYRKPLSVAVAASKTVNLPRLALVDPVQSVVSRVTYRGLPIEGVDLGGDVWTDRAGKGAAEWTPARRSAAAYSPFHLGGWDSPLYFTVSSPTSVTRASDLKAIELSGVGGA